MKIKELHILYFTLFLHAIASAFTGLFEGGTINPGTLRGVIVSLFVLYFIFRRFKIDNKTIGFLAIYLIYLCSLTFISSHFITSFYQYVGFFISLMMLPIGYYYINSVERLYQLSKVLLWVLAFITGSVLVSNMLGIGTSDYLEDSFYFGGGRVNITKTMVILLFSAPIYLYLEKGYMRNIAIVIYVTSLAVCLIGIKRSVLLTIIVGIGLFILFGPNLKNNAKYVITGGLLFLVSLPLYGDMFVERFEARSERVAIDQKTLDTESRYHEVYMVMDAIANDGWRHRLIGSNLFNDRSYFNTQRMLHTDYMILLNGSGVIGIASWILFLATLLIWKISLYKRISKNNFVKILNAVFWILLTSQVLISISGTVYAVSLRTYLYLMLGGVLSVFNNYNR